MESALAEIEFLALSPNRVAVLRCLAEDRHTRTDLAVVADDERLRRRLESLVGAPDASVRVRDGGVPLAVTVADDVVHLLLRDANGVLQASVDTDDAAVRDWADARFERYWDAASPVDDTDLGE